MKCKKCKGLLTLNMKACPECGEKNVIYMSQKKQAGCLIIFVVPLLVVMFINKGNNDEVAAETEIKVVKQETLQSFNYIQQVTVLSEAYDNLKHLDYLWQTMINTNSYNQEGVADINRKINTYLHDKLEKEKFDEKLHSLQKIIRNGYYGISIYSNYYKPGDKTGNLKLARKKVKESLEMGKKLLEIIDPVFKFKEVVKLLEKKKAIPEIGNITYSNSTLTVLFYATFPKLSPAKQEATKSVLRNAWNIINKNTQTKLAFTYIDKK